MTPRRPAPPHPLPQLADHHALIAGGTRRGKSGNLELIARATPRHEAFSLVDPHGSCARAVLEYLANPAHGQHDRVVHLIDAASDMVVGINPLEPHSDTPEGWHEAAITLASAVESRFEASPEETPRLARLLYIGGYLCARRGLTVIELLELFTVGGEDLRTALITDFDDHIIRRELEDLHLLAVRNVREFMTLVESCKNRLLRWLGDRRLRRMLGQSRGLSPRAIMDGAEIVLADLSALAYADAALVGTIMTSMYTAAARRRPPLHGAIHRLIVDEAESLITIDTARAADQLAKHRLLLMLCVQRLGQLRARGDFIADALFVNCGVKICFGGLDPESARFMAEMLFAGHIDLEQWKEGSARPTIVGVDKIILKGRTRGRHQAEGQGRAQGHARSTSRFAAATDTFLSSWGSVVSGGSTMLTGPDALVSVSDGQASSRAGARGRSRAAGSQSGEANVASRSQVRIGGNSDAVSEAEALMPRYENLPTQMFSLEEQLARHTWELMALPRRECVIRVESEAPIQTRTRDLEPAFQSAAFRVQCLPLYLAKLARTARYARPAAVVDQEIQKRLAGNTAPPVIEEPDFSLPEPDPRVVHLPTRPRPLSNRNEE